ncbi:MAG TPA: Xaa-Pro peptidase family protein [Candidatus Sulfotelmatobacter sp.]|nr:Xaa-Pro peptidase family protein [Candidatus Sulfotelmatobacter sp.]
MDRLRVSFSALRADALLVSHLPNIQYLCGFTGSAGLLLIEPNRSTLFTDSRYTFQAQEEVGGAGVQIAKKGLVRAVGMALRRRRGRTRVAYAASQVSAAQKEALVRQAGSRVRWTDGGGLVEKLRAVKDSGELATMREAAQLISAVFEELVPKINPGTSELQLAAEIDYAIKLRGASGPSFETIVASGERSAWAHARPSAKLLGKNELVVLDQGAILRGYCSDMTRTVFLGQAPENVRKMYQAVREAQAVAKAGIRPGVSAGAVDRAARRILRGYGLDRRFTHSTGHGLGLEVHEIPRLGQREETILEESMVLTVEPGVYVEGVGGIRIEDDVVVTASGAEDLTSAPQELLEL